MSAAANREDRSPERIEAEIEHTRAEISETLDAIERKLSPGQLMDQTIDYFFSGPGEFGANLANQIKANPIPVALIGIGLGWLMVAGQREARPRRYRVGTRSGVFDREYDDPYRVYADEPLGAHEHAGRYVAYDEDVVAGRRAWGAGVREARSPGAYVDPLSSGAGIPRAHARVDTQENRGPSMMDRTKEAAGSAAEQAKEKAGAAYERAKDAAGTAKDAAGTAYEKARETAAGATRWGSDTAERARTGTDRMAGNTQQRAHGAGEYGRAAWHQAEEYGAYARRQAERTRQGFGQMLHDHPFLLAALGLAIGAAIGAALPRTRREDEWVGEYRDEFLQRASELGLEAIEAARHVAERARDAAIEEAERQGLTPEEVRRRGEEAFRAVQDKARSVAEAAHDEAERQGLTPDAAMRAARSKADRVIAAAREEAERQGLSPEGLRERGEGAVHRAQEKVKSVAEAAREAAKEEADKQVHKVTGEAEKQKEEVKQEAKGATTGTTGSGARPGTSTSGPAKTSAPGTGSPATGGTSTSSSGDKPAADKPLGPKTATSQTPGKTTTSSL